MFFQSGNGNVPESRGQRKRQRGKIIDFRDAMRFSNETAASTTGQNWPERWRGGIFMPIFGEMLFTENNLYYLSLVGRNFCSQIIGRTLLNSKKYKMTK